MPPEGVSQQAAKTITGHETNVVFAPVHRRRHRLNGWGGDPDVLLPKGRVAASAEFSDMTGS